MFAHLYSDCVLVDASLDTLRTRRAVSSARIPTAIEASRRLFASFQNLCFSSCVCQFVDAVRAIRAGKVRFSPCKVYDARAATENAERIQQRPANCTGCALLLLPPPLHVFQAASTLTATAILEAGRRSLDL